MSTKHDREQPLSVKMDDDVLIIRIGLDRLAYCAETSPEFYCGETGRYCLKVTNRHGFANDVILALNHEEDDGSTPVERMLDAAIVAAFEDGSEHMRDLRDSNREEEDEP